MLPILLEPLIASFCKAYPEVEVEVAASGESVDLAAEGFDACIRLGQFIAADMVAVTDAARFASSSSVVPPTSPEAAGRSGRKIYATMHVCALGDQAVRDSTKQLPSLARG